MRCYGKIGFKFFEEEPTVLNRELSVKISKTEIFVVEALKEII